MQHDRSDRPDVIALPPVILVATIARGLVLNFFVPASFLPKMIAAPLGFSTAFVAIEPEEAYLEQKFGDKYLRYNAKVRRWI
ncbi:MAG TPA: hypothetical protein VNY06_05980 [Methylocella sp.]|nr:hypothetical protein [Methylocella sp.]